MKKVTPPLVVPTPCHAAWANMSGDEKKRFCGECGKHVYNLSAMTEGEAQKFAHETQGRECVAYVRTEDARMLVPNFPERFILRLAGWKPAMARMLVWVLPAALASCVSRNIPTAGVPVFPGKTTVPQEPQPPEKPFAGGLPDTPSPQPVPGSPRPMVVGKVAMPKE